MLTRWPWARPTILGDNRRRKNPMQDDSRVACRDCEQTDRYCQSIRGQACFSGVISSTFFMLVLGAVDAVASAAAAAAANTTDTAEAWWCYTTDAVPGEPSLGQRHTHSELMHGKSLERSFNFTCITCTFNPNRVSLPLTWFCRTWSFSTYLPVSNLPKLHGLKKP